MDWLDRISATAIAGLVTASVVLSVEHSPDDRSGRSRRQASRAAVADHRPAELEREAQSIRRLLSGGGLRKAETLASALVDRFPHDGEPYMLLGDVYLRQQALFRALREYRQAVDLDPDYLDKATPRFQGRKLMHVVDEALSELDHAADATDEDRRLIYYLLRRIAGSCG